MEYCNSHKQNGAIVFLDQEKCFDRVEHGFVCKVMQKMGYGDKFIKWITIFFNQIYSRILINGNFTKLIPIDRGIRQGDAPCSLLYVMVAETLASSIRKNNLIKA